MIFKPKRNLSGANLDIRPQREKNLDYQFNELVASASPVMWREKPESEWRKFLISDQGTSGSCVAHTLAKQLQILYWLKTSSKVKFSATHIYQRRANKPYQGMAVTDVFKIGQGGVTLEVLAPHEGLSDSQMDSFKIEEFNKDVGKVFAIGNWLYTPVDIDTIASVIQTTGKGVMVWFYWQYDEWTSTPKVKYPSLTADKAEGRHSVTAVDFTLHNGKKALIIEDSWGPKTAIDGRRIIDEDFVKARCYMAAYPMNFKFDEVVLTKPKYKFTKNLQFVPVKTFDKDVVALQDILKYEGVFPANVDSTGWYGAVTAESVKKWQKKHFIDTEATLDLLGGKFAGPKTIAKLNELYS
jgi:hypothetical protein